MDNRTFRHAMGKFATGITVLTTEVAGEIHGMTANAFMSVSLEPKLILISIDKKANMLSKIRTANTFAVNVLAEEQQTYSMIFAGQLKEHETVSFARLNGLPVLQDALLTLACRVYAEYEAGDHILFVGKVGELQMKEGDPLLFYCGKYRSIRDWQEQLLV